MSGRKQGEAPADEGGSGPSGNKPPRIKISKSSEGSDAKVLILDLSGCFEK